MHRFRIIEEKKRLKNTLSIFGKLGETDMDDRQQIEIRNSELCILQRENQILKEILDEAGIPYQDRLSRNNPDVQAAYDPDQGSRIRPLLINQEMIDSFFQMLNGRKNVYDLRYTNVKTGKVGYYTQCFNFWKKMA